MLKYDLAYWKKSSIQHSLEYETLVKREMAAESKQTDADLEEWVVNWMNY